ncbi:hypothetical protein COLU111180_16545 [Cohnella lubricantis]|uniref:Dihydroorotate dehydrogenase catalytic domain-containing protein n=1 Tax=Cohnella lubricantis TaxID=2163172 RepID=A0A841TCC1_9BACL|nr:hypothetical protein [Cohnella lubricantis]MBB6677018.1 hypothetical protein [Cohnella lubricantis]MBP2119316.1 hypothetical protein [Cohnella lubricantis]
MLDLFVDIDAPIPDCVVLDTDARLAEDTEKIAHLNTGDELREQCELRHIPVVGIGEKMNSELRSNGRRRRTATAQAVVLAHPSHDLPQYVRIAPMPGASAEDAESQLLQLIGDLLSSGAAGLYVDTLSLELEASECLRVLNRVATAVPAVTAAAAVEAEEGSSLFLYLSPDEPEERLRYLLGNINRSAWDGVVIGGEVREEDGAVEGAGAKATALATLQSVRQFGSADWTIKVAAGVHEPQDAIDYLRAGANAVLLGSGLVFAGPGLPKRINDAVIHEAVQDMAEPDPPSFWRHWGWMCLLGIGMMIGGFLAFIIAASTVLLPYDEDFLGMTRAQLKTFNGHLLHFMSHDRITLAGTMVSTGVLYYQLAKHGMRCGLHWARTAVAASCIAGFPSFFLYLGYGFFDPLHAAAAIILLPMFLLSMRRNPDRPYRGLVTLINDRIWRRAMWGQLCFITLGIALAVGGVTIAGFGVTRVFVPTDLAYMQVTTGELDAFNPRLIPLIAHDRAGFGGALFADAIVLLITALWGIQLGQSWLWRTLLLGGAPAFFSALSVHFDIGYTDVVHLLPAWIALALYIAGLILLYPYMHSQSRSASPPESTTRSPSRL